MGLPSRSLAHTEKTRQSHGGLSVLVTSLLLLLSGHAVEVASGCDGYGGHVSIKVYCGLSHGHGYHSFSPFGYHVHLLPDNHGYHGQGARTPTTDRIQPCDHNRLLPMGVVGPPETAMSQAHHPSRTGTAMTLIKARTGISFLEMQVKFISATIFSCILNCILVVHLTTDYSFAVEEFCTWF